MIQQQNEKNIFTTKAFLIGSIFGCAVIEAPKSVSCKLLLSFLIAGTKTDMPDLSPKDAMIHRKYNTY